MPVAELLSRGQPWHYPLTTGWNADKPRWGFVIHQACADTGRRKCLLSAEISAMNIFSRALGAEALLCQFEYLLRYFDWQWSHLQARSAQLLTHLDCNGNMIHIIQTALLPMLSPISKLPPTNYVTAFQSQRSWWVIKDMLPATAWHTACHRHRYTTGHMNQYRSIL